MSTRERIEKRGDGRVPVTIGLRPSTNATVDRWLKATGGWGKAKFIETLVERFAAMPESVQQIMLGRVPDDMRNDYAKKAADFFEAAARDPNVWETKEEEPIQIDGGKRLRAVAAKKREQL